jgi:hypothetical protein
VSNELAMAQWGAVVIAWIQSMRWYFWFVAAVVLFAVGIGALVVLGDGKTATGEDDTGW